MIKNIPSESGNYVMAVFVNGSIFIPKVSLAAFHGSADV